jgi:hydroxyacylglutathione hydrolase
MEHTAILVDEDNLTHVFYERKSAIVFDPLDPDLVRHSLRVDLKKDIIYDSNGIKDEVETHSRDLLCSFTTHHHEDHSRGNKAVHTFCKKIVSGSRKSYHTEICKDLQIYNYPGIEVECIHTPCHTNDSFCFYVQSEDKKYLVTGDTIFCLGIGKFFEGSGKDMVKNIVKIVNKVPEDTILLYGHDYSVKDALFAEKYVSIPRHVREKKFLMLGEEVEYNPFFGIALNDKEEEEKSQEMDNLRAEKDRF